MPTTASKTWSNAGLQPAYPDNDVEMIAVRLTASKIYPQGCLLGEVTATPGVFAPYDDGANDGTEVAKLINKHACMTDAAGLISFGSLAPLATTGANNAAGQKDVVVGAGETALFAVGDTVLIGTGATQETHVIAAITAGTNTLTTTVNLAANQNAVKVQKILPQISGDEHGKKGLTAVAYRMGTFRTADLYQVPGDCGGIDANAVADLGRLVQGTTAAGLLSVG